jgi:hypothetical protein
MIGPGEAIRPGTHADGLVRFFLMTRASEETIGGVDEKSFVERPPVLLRLLCFWQLHEKGTAAAHPFAFHTYATAMFFNDRLYDGKAEARSLLFFC